MRILKHKLLAKKLQLRNYFLIEYLTFYAAGFDLSLKENTWKYPWLTLSTGFCIFTLIIGAIHYSYININELDKVADALAPCISSSLTIWKCLIFIFRSKDLVNLIHRVWELTEQASPLDLKIIRKENLTPRRIGVIYCAIISLSVLSYLALPFIIGFKTYWSTGKYYYKTLLTSSFPFEFDEPLTYLITYVWCMLGMYFNIFFTIGVDSLYSWSVHNITAQFQVLQMKIRTISKQLDNVSIRNNLVHCIIYHQQTIALAEQLNRAFRPIVLAEFTVNSTQLCFIVYQIGRGLDMSNMPFLFSFMLTILMQLLVYSHGGQHLEDESEKVALVVYESVQLQFCHIREQKMLLLLILRAQKSCKMTAIFSFVNMRLFVWVIQTAGSYVAVLWSVGKN